MKRIRLTPTLLALALACFFLPWIEIKCDSGTFTRTGLQLARGNWTFTSSWYSHDPPQTAEPDWEKSDANAVVYGASAVVGLGVALFVSVFPWRQLLLAVSTSTALVCLGLLTRRICAESTGDEIKWGFTVWFFATWALNAAALAVVVWELVSRVRRLRGAVGEGESSSV